MFLGGFIRELQVKIFGFSTKRGILHSKSTTPTHICVDLPLRARKTRLQLGTMSKMYTTMFTVILNVKACPRSHIRKCMTCMPMVYCCWNWVFGTSSASGSKAMTPTMPTTCRPEFWTYLSRILVTKWVPNTKKLRAHVSTAILVYFKMMTSRQILQKHSRNEYWSLYELEFTSIQCISIPERGLN